MLSLSHSIFRLYNLSPNNSDTPRDRDSTTSRRSPREFRCTQRRNLMQDFLSYSCNSLAHEPQLHLKGTEQKGD